MSRPYSSVAAGEATRQRILQALHAFKNRDHKPTQYQIARCIGVSQKTVSDQLRRLREAGKLGGLDAPGRNAAP